MFSLGCCVRVVLQQVVCDELKRVVWSCLAHFVERSHNSGYNSCVQVGLCRQCVDIDLRLGSHCSKLSTEALSQSTSVCFTSSGSS